MMTRMNCLTISSKSALETVTLNMTVSWAALIPLFRSQMYSISARIRHFLHQRLVRKRTLERLSPKNYPLFTPFWVAPFPILAPYDDEKFIVKPSEFEDHRNARMSVFGAIIDPFTSVQVYSSFLLPMSLTLPHWSWQSAMNTMTAFFHTGPLTVPLNDVPDYDSKQLLTSENARNMPLRNLPLPSPGPGDRPFFQPYAQPSEKEDPCPNSIHLVLKRLVTSPSLGCRRVRILPLRGLCS